MSELLRIPYPGLRAFDSSESDLFFGREGCVDDMITLLARTRFLAVLGTSGSGKSSLVRTGLLDSLELGFLPGAGSRWLIADMAPGGRPIQNLARALAVSSDAGGHSAHLLESFLARGPRSLEQWCADGNLPDDTSLLLLVDQFEELFRYQDYAGQEQAEAFVALLLESARSSQPIHVVITMRSEFLGACALMPGLAESINDSLYLTRRMTREECQEAIEGPATVLGFKVEPKLVNRILNDLATFAPWDAETTGGSLAQLARRADQLPLMQHVLNRLWLRARERGGDIVLLHDDYDGLGGLRGAIDAHAEDVMQTIPAKHRHGIQTVFRALISGNTITDAVRNPRRFEELIALSDDPEAIRSTVDAFRADGCNFLRPSVARPIENDTVIDLGHESLIRQWSQMEGWLANESRSRAAWRRLVASAEAYAEGEGDLLGGLGLDNARDWWSRENPSEAWASNNGGDYSATRAFLEASVEAEEARLVAEAAEAKRAQRALRFRAAAFLTLAVIGIGAAIFAFNAQNEALDARDMANEQRAAVEQSQALTIEAADTLLIDVATQLQRSVGVPRSQVEQMFADAKAFLDKVETHVDDPKRLYSVRARLALEQAADAWNRAEFDAASVHVDAARSAIESAKSPDDYSGSDVDQMLRIISYEYWAHNRKDRRDETRAALAKIVDFLDQHRSKLSPDDVHYWDAVIEARWATARAQDDDWDASFDHASACLRHVSEIEELSFRDKAVQMRCTARKLGVAQELERNDPELVEDAEASLNLIGDDEKSRSDWGAWAWLKRELADAAHQRDDLVTADRHIVDRIQRYENLWAAEPEEDDWGNGVAGGYHNRGFFFGRRWMSDRAYEASLKSAETYKKLSDTFEDWPVRAEDYAVVLNNLRISANRLEDRHTDPEFMATYIYWLEERLRHLEFMVEKEIEKECNGCTFDQILLIQNAHGAMLKLGEVASADALVSTYDRLIDRAWDQMDEARTDLEAHRARYHVAAASQNLAANLRSSMGQIPDVDAVRLADDVIPRVERYLERFPRDVYVRQIVGNMYARLAELHADADRDDIAVSTMQRGIELGSYAAHTKMQDWLSTGDGPVQRDPAKADAIQTALETHSPGTYNILLSGKNLLIEDPDTTADRVNLFVPDDPDISAVDEVIWRSRMLGGHEIDPAEVERLRDYEKVAIDQGIPFPVAVLQERSQGTDLLVHGMSVDDHLAYFYERLPAPDEQVKIGNRALEALVLASIYEETRDTATQTLLRIIRDREHPNYRHAMDFVYSIVGGLSAYHSPAAERLGGDFIRGRKERERDIMRALQEEFDAMSPEHLARILSRRGFGPTVYAKPGLRHLGAQDTQAALALAPDDPTVLNNAAFLWLDQPHLRPIAVTTLERALALQEPGTDDHTSTMDSLGWAYVLTGRVEEGRDLIERAIAQVRSPSSEMHYHLAEAYRRLGRTQEALDEIAIATSLAPDQSYLEEKIRQFFRDIEPDRSYSAASFAAAQQLADEIDDMKLNRKTVSMDGAGVAIRGYDPVALSQQKQPRVGRLEHFAIWNDAVWLFESDANRDAFEADPAAYAPIAGGFVPRLDVTRTRQRRHGSPHFGVVLGEKLLLSGGNEREYLQSLGASFAEKAEIEWSRAQHVLDMPPSPPSLYEHLLLKVQNEE